MATKETIASLLDEWEPKIRQAFLSSVDEIRSKAEIGRIADMLERGDIHAALRAVHLDPAAFKDLDGAISGSFNAGGSATAGNLPILRDAGGGLVIVRFDGRNIEAENILRTQSSNLVTNIIEDQRTMLRNTLTSGMEAGSNPRTVALDIVGRYNRLTGQREGGFIGLTAAQQQTVAKLSAGLLSGDEQALRDYLTLARRDKRFDRAVLKALEEGKPLDKPTIDRIVSRYKDGLLKLRGETIGRTEALSSLHNAQNEAIRQAILSGAVKPEQVRRIWRSAADDRVRESHRFMNGQSVGLYERFPNGLLYPGEPGAPASEVINCRCNLDIRIDFLANIR
jgi:hypothetical protein